MISKLPGDGMTSEIPQSPPASADVRSEMIHRLVHTDAHFKHQQRGEPDLTPEDKSVIALEIFTKSPAVFLERFSKYLSSDDVECFQELRGDYLIDYYLEEISRRTCSSSKNKVKNRRFQALQKLINEGEYFSEDEMKWRNPLLYEQMIGQYASESEKMEQAEQEIDRSDLKFSTILLKHMDMQETKQYYEQQKEIEEQQEEEDEEEDSDEDSSEHETDEDNDNSDKKSSKCKKENSNQDSEITDTDRNFFKGEFLRIMQERFLSGEDSNFDYSKVDNNVDYDSLDIVGHDAEEKYFDADDDFSDDNIDELRLRPGNKDVQCERERNSKHCGD